LAFVAVLVNNNKNKNKLIFAENIQDGIYEEPNVLNVENFYEEPRIIPNYDLASTEEIQNNYDLADNNVEQDH